MIAYHILLKSEVAFKNKNGYFFDANGYLFMIFCRKMLKNVKYTENASLYAFANL